MAEWRLVDLGGLDGFTIQSVYEAVAEAVSRKLSPNTLILCYPREPYVCVGVNQMVHAEVDVEYCKSHGLPIVRRKLGGGAVYLNDGQQFYHIIVHLENMPDIGEFYRKYLKPTVYTYRSFGLDASYKPLNDVIVSGRKASGNAAAWIGRSGILIGNVILDIDPAKLSRTLKVPDEKFRDKLAKTMEEWITSLKRELGYVPEREEVKRRFIEGFRKELGVEFYEDSLSDFETRSLEKIRSELAGEEWTFRVSRRHKDLKPTGGRKVKIASDVYLCEASLKREKLLRVILKAESGVIKDVVLSGDFFAEPMDATEMVEKSLVGCEISKNEIENRINDVFERSELKFYGISKEDIAEAILKAYMNKV